MDMGVDTEVVSEAVYFEPVLRPPRLAIEGYDWRPHSMVCAETELTAIAHSFGLERESTKEAEGTRRALLAAAVAQAAELDGARIVFVGTQTVFRDGEIELTPILVCLFSEWPDIATAANLVAYDQEGNELQAVPLPGRLLPRLLHVAVTTWDLVGDCLHLVGSLEELGGVADPLIGTTDQYPAVA